MNKLKIRILLVVMALVSALGVGANAGNVVIKAKLDSAAMLMGKVNGLNVSVVQDKNAFGSLNLDEVEREWIPAVEIADKLKADTTDLGNNRIEIKKKYLIQSFDSGAYELPPVLFIADKDTFKSEALHLKVVPVLSADTLKTVHDFKPIMEEPFRLRDMVPDVIDDYWWLYFVVILLVVAGLLAYLYYKKRGKLPFVKQQPPMLPPYEEAMLHLNELKERKLWQSGQGKEYYTSLTDILRRYIARQLNVNAVEMTTDQIISALKENSDVKGVNEMLGQVLELADFVKFANYQPEADDNEVSYQRTYNFVEANKPEPVAVPDENNNENKENKEEKQ